jgi:hypothetical protein
MAMTSPLIFIYKFTMSIAQSQEKYSNFYINLPVKKLPSTLFKQYMAANLFEI